MAVRCTPAEAIAASLCWLARDRHGEQLGKTAGEVVNKGIAQHRPNCRFCRMPKEELLTTYGLSNVEPGTYKAFTDLSPKARWARIREAQEVQWFEQLD